MASGIEIDESTSGGDAATAESGSDESDVVGMADPTELENAGDQPEALAALTPWPARKLGGLLLVAGLGGVVSASALNIERLLHETEPNRAASCSINPIVECTSVMTSWQATVWFGLSNSIIGIALFGALLAVAAVLLANVVLPRWFWLGLQAGTVFGAAMVHWLIYQTLFDIGKLCPYCMVVWAVTVPAFWYVTLYNLRHGHLRTRGRSAIAAAWMIRNHWFLLALWFVTVAFTIFMRFFDFWTGQLF